MVVSLNISLDGQRGDWYTNHDRVKGTVSVGVTSSTEVTRIKVALIGISMTHVNRVYDVGQKFLDQVEERSVVLSMTNQLFPPPDKQFGSSYCLKPDTYSWPFDFEIPMKTTGLQKTILPPSLSDVPKDVAYIRYYLNAVVDYSVPVLRIGNNSMSAESSIPLVFLPTDPEDIETVSTYGVLHTSKSALIPKSKLGGLISKLRTTFAHDMASTCTNAKFTVRMELLLTPASKFSWFLEALPAAGQEMRVLGVKVVLKSYTHVRAKNLDETVENALVLLERRDLALAPGDVTAQMGSPVLIVPSVVPPTFRGPNVQREYRIEVRVYWSHTSSNLMHKAVARKRVWIRSGMQALPNYETGESVRPNRDYPQHKWYYKI